MSRSRRKGREGAHGTAARGTVARCGSLFAMLSLALFLTRLFVPAESAAQGETLWIVCCWLLLGAIGCWWQFRFGETAAESGGSFGNSAQTGSVATAGLTAHCRWGLSDLAVAMMVAGSVVSALLVLGQGGEQRPALNMLWEWIGIGTAWCCLRWVMREEHSRRHWQQAVIAIGLLLAGLGFWQRLVIQPQLAARFQEADALQRAPRSHDPDERSRQNARLRELQLELGPEFLALDEMGRAALSQRLLFSTEPTGRFALTNTFAGLLIVVLLQLIAPLLLRRSEMTSRQRWLTIASIVLVLGCVVLTKSKTAWIGLLIGSFWLLLVASRQGGVRDRARFWLRGVVVVATTSLFMVGVGLFTGALDREVFTEASKSLRYRWQYWDGAMQIIVEHPIAGVGPGNFGVQYLKYKLPEASEAVSDPHNMFLDVWISGGVLALGGLLVILANACRGLYSLGRSTPSPVDQSTCVHVTDLDVRECGAGGWTCVAVAGIGAGILVWVAQWFLSGQMDSQLLVLTLLWPCVAWLVSRMGLADSGQGSAHAVTARSASWAGGLGLGVHLLGAGGIAMPAITLLLLWLCSNGEGTSMEWGTGGRGALGRAIERAERWARSIGWMGSSALSGLLLVACLTSSLIPVILSTSQSRSGKLALHVDRRPLSALTFFRQAAEADRWNAEPWRDLSLAQFLAWQSGGVGAAEHLQECWVSANQAIRLNPENPYSLQFLADLRMEHWRRTGDVGSATQAVESFRLARSFYPNSVTLRASLAKGLHAVGEIDAARVEASEALRLNGINEREGHSDKLLPLRVVTELQQM